MYLQALSMLAHVMVMWQSVLRHQTLAPNPTNDRDLSLTDLLTSVSLCFKSTTATSVRTPMKEP